MSRPGWWGGAANERDALVNPIYQPIDCLMEADLLRSMDLLSTFQHH